MLRNWPQHTHINWSEVARDHQVPGKNAGQVMNEFASLKGIHVHISETPHRVHVCSSKRRLLGGIVSVPSTPSLLEVNT